MASRRQRILFLNNQGIGSTGGGVTILRHVARHLAASHDVTVASFDQDAAACTGLMHVTLSPPARPYWRVAPLLRARHLARTVPPALLHDSELVVTLDPHFAGAVARTPPRRLLHLSLSCTPRQETAGSSGAQAVLTFLQYVALERRVLRRADAVVVASRLHARELRRFEALPRLRPHVLYPVFGSHEVQPARTVARPFTVLAAGRLEPAKRLDCVVKLARDVRDVDCRFVIAGDGPERGRLEALAAGLPVTFLGAVPDVAPLLAAADLFVHASRYESFGIVLVEAMRAGVPSLCAAGDAVIGAREVMTDGVETCLVDFDQQGAASAALRRLAADSAARAAMGQAGRKRAAALLAENYVAKFAAIVDGLLA